MITNVPGPQVLLYVLDRQLADLYAIAFLADQRALSMAVTSYNGGIRFGLLGDHETMPDLDALGQDVEAAVGEFATGAGR